MSLYIRVPFGLSGDKTTVPVTAAAAGPVSYTYGWGSDYSLVQTDPAALNVERRAMNQVLYDVTANIQLYQQHGVPEFITTSDNGGVAFQYDKYATVRYASGGETGNYVSLVASNAELPSNTSYWKKLTYDYVSLGVANTFTAIQTIACDDTPLVVDSTNGTLGKIAFKESGTLRGLIGGNAAYALAAYLADGTTIAMGVNSSGHLVPGASSTYDLGVIGSLWRNVLADRLTVSGTTAPTNGLYLPSANTLGISANSLRVASFRVSGSAVNFFDFLAVSTGSAPALFFAGSDTNVSASLVTQGTGTFGFFTNSASAVEQFGITHTANSVNRIRATGSATGSAPSLFINGTDTDVDFNVSPKNAGLFKLGNSGSFAANGTATITVSNLGPAGIATATIKKWLMIKDNSGTVLYIPAWGA